MTPIDILKKYHQLVRAGLSHSEIGVIHEGRQAQASKKQRYRQCPACQAVHADTGEALSHCHCGWCRHASLDNTPKGFRCNACGEMNPKHFEMRREHEVVHDEVPAIVAKGTL